MKSEIIYWKEVPSNPWRVKGAENFFHAMRMLLLVGRQFDAISMAYGAVESGEEVPSQTLLELLESSTIVQTQTKPTRDLRYELQKIFTQLQNDETIAPARLAKLEWLYLSIFDSNILGRKKKGSVQPSALLDSMCDDPAFFVELMSHAYRSRDATEEQSKTETDRLRAEQSYRLLESMDRLPGLVDGEFDRSKFESWFNTVRESLTETGRQESFDSVLGGIFVRATQIEDGPWPSHELAAAIEPLATDSFLSGFSVQIFNSRGITSRAPTEGGNQEREEANRFRNLADHVRDASPKLAAVFTRLRERYEHEANWEDEMADRERWGR